MITFLQVLVLCCVRILNFALNLVLGPAPAHVFVDVLALCFYDTS